MPKFQAFNSLPSGSVVAERIESAYPDLSSALKKFADFVISEPMQAAHLSINETVHASGVSVATANRFARKLGFDGYAQFRSELIRGFEPMLAPVERLKQTISEGSTVSDIITASLAEDIQNLRENELGLESGRFETAVDMIIKAERVYLLAFDNAAALGGIFAHRLATAGKSVTESTGGKLSASRHLALYGPDDLVIVIAFPRYIRDTVEMAQAIHRRGLPILAITDTQASPIASLGTLTLYIQARRTIGSTSDTAILAVLEALAAAVSAHLPGAAEAGEHFADLAYPWLIGPDEKPDKK